MAKVREELGLSILAQSKIPFFLPPPVTEKYGGRIYGHMQKLR